ncbi:ankyrin repeat-containing domain protein [Multifurca ochricompacta]|uniref:Ankyrin repeat-containing domain protein n=1 Tax=Multifurca ochricompacta TaxID=376703 RepID=A0AAD4QPV9_9AGAM|nr:ankyrin repeat-containing domain protein [Multifurca ochricompacta]
MAEKDSSARLRKAVRENNLFLVKRLIQRIDMRNPDPGPKRYTSLAWAVVEGNEDMFEYLLNAGHDDDELSRDSENSTILILLADTKPPLANPYGSSDPDFMGAALRMARMYYDRYPFILDWSDSSGKTALHAAALKGNEELVRMLCDLGADFDLSDNQGNTPLHYASAWGHIPIVQLLIERGCQFAAKNNLGYSPSDYAYSYSIRDTLESTARAQVELNRRARRVFAQAAARAAELDGFEPPMKALGVGNSMRNRSGSAASYTTATSDSGDVESLPSGYSYNSGISSTSPQHTYRSGASSSGSTGTFSASSPTPAFSYSGNSLLSSVSNPASALSPIASRVLEQDASAMEAYLRRNRSGSGSMDVRTVESAIPSPTAPLGSTPVSSGPSVNGDDLASLPDVSGSVAPRRRLRPSLSAAQLRSHGKPPFIVTTHTSSQDVTPTPRNRAGTNPTITIPGPPRSPLTDSFSSTNSTSRAVPSRNSSLNALSITKDENEEERFIGPSSDYAVFPDPPEEESSPNVTPTVTNTPTTSRRLPFNLLSKPLPSIDLHHGHGHRRGASIHSLR